jgi:Undecaprenyl-phosphate glucose phosphotransferase
LLKKQHELFVSLLCVSDAAVVVVASLIAWITRKVLALPLTPGYRFWPESWESYFKEPLVLFSVPVTLYALWFFGLYEPRRDRTLRTEYLQLIKASIVSVMALVVVLWAIGNGQIVSPGQGSAGQPLIATILDVQRAQVLILAVVLPVALMVHRTAFRFGLRIIRRRGWNQRHVGIIGVGRVGRIACQTIERNSWTGLNVSYFISHRETNRLTECQGKPVLGGIEKLEAILDEHPVDAVYVAVPTARSAIVPRLLHRLDRVAVDVRIIPDVNPRFVPQSMATNELDGMPVLGYRESPMCGFGGLVKRTVDFVGALTAMILFSPIFLVCAAAVAASGRGPIIFRQRRVSLGGEVFCIYKFRTMRCVEKEAAGCEARWTSRDDPRITRVGALLRKTSLDELPQLFNVLKGEMSLVGPRPERPELIDRFRDDWRGYMLRQHVKAGITGWAQVNGLRGDTSLRKRLQYDLFYIRNWSVWLDLRILTLTVFRGFVHRNAH